MGEDLPCYSSKIYPVSLKKCPRDHYPVDKANLSDSRVTNISRSFTQKMAAKTSWHRYGTKLRHCHPMYRPTERQRRAPSSNGAAAVRRPAANSSSVIFFSRRRSTSAVGIEIPMGSGAARGGKGGSFPPMGGRPKIM